VARFLQSVDVAEIVFYTQQRPDTGCKKMGEKAMCNIEPNTKAKRSSSRQLPICQETGSK
jgi:hypothetical protein